MRGDGNQPSAFENAFAEIEGLAAPVLSKILDTDTVAINHDDRYRLSMWIALQHLRTASSRRGSEDIYRSLAKLKVGLGSTDQLRDQLSLPADTQDEVVERIRADMLKTAGTFKVDTRHHLQAIADSLEGMTNLVFFRQPWAVADFRHKALGTSDTPLILVPDLEHSEDGTSLGTASHLILPLHRRAVLIMGTLANEPIFVRMPGTAKIANMVNVQTLQNARSAAFHHPDDRPFEGMVTPETEDSEVFTDHGQVDALVAAYGGLRHLG